MQFVLWNNVMKYWNMSESSTRSIGMPTSISSKVNRFAEYIRIQCVGHGFVWGIIYGICMSFVLLCWVSLVLCNSMLGGSYLANTMAARESFQYEDPLWVHLTHWGRDKMATVSQTTLSNAFSWMKMLEFRLRFHWSLFLRVQLTIFQHWFR